MNFFGGKTDDQPVDPAAGAMPTPPTDPAAPTSPMDSSSDLAGGMPPTGAPTPPPANDWSAPAADAPAAVPEASAMPAADPAVPAPEAPAAPAVDGVPADPAAPADGGQAPKW